MKRSGALAFWLWMVMMGSPVGPQSRAAEPEPPRQQPILVGFNRDFPPFEFLDSTGQPAGYDIDLIRAAAAEVELPLVFQADTWDHIKARVEAGHIDVVPGMLYSEKRAALVEFSAPHLLVHYCIFIRKGTQGVAALSDLRGKKILVERTSRMHELLLVQGFGAEVRPVASEPEALRVLSSGPGFDAAILPRLEGLEMIQDLHLANIQPLPGSVLSEELCFAVAKGRGSLRAKLDSGMAILHRSGKYRKIYDKWLGVLEPEQGLSPRMTKFLEWTAIAALGLVALPLAWSWSLRKQVYQRTTALRKSEEATRASNAKLQAVFDATSDAIFFHDPETGAILDVNQRAADLYGYTREELLARDVVDLSSGVPPYTQESALHWIHEAARGIPQTFEWHARSKSGQLFWIEVTMRKARIEGQEQLVASVRDITQRKEETERVRSSEEKFNKVFQHAPLLVSLSRQADGLLLDVNERSCQELGFSREEVISRTSGELGVMLPEDRARFIEMLEIHGSVRNFECTLYAKDGRPVICLISGEVVRLGDEPLLLAMIVDITELNQAEKMRRRLEAELLQSQKLESLGSLAGGVAHDMNNVLGAILGLASANLEVQPPGSPTHRAFETISKAAIRGGEMVRSLLSFARQSRVEERELDLNALLQEQVRLLERTTLSKVRLEMDLEPDLRPIRGDANALTHAFMNLCVNAVDAMPETGTLTLRTRNVDDDSVEVRVEDTGTGMPKEVLERALDPFFTTKEMGKGTGLGLSMVYTTVKAHQGQMEILSEPGRGTAVRLQFPACEPAAQAAEGPEGPRSGTPPRTLNVLLVDDDELIQNSMETVLQALGHAVVSTLSGEAALAIIEAGFEPDVVILDMNMPGFGGAGTLPRLRALLPEVPVLLSTGRADQAAVNLAEAHPHVTLLPKPFSFVKLQQCLERLSRP